MRLYSLDLLRFIAAFSVVLYHYTGTSDPDFPVLASFTKFGYLGVPLFFIISGFVIFASAQNRTPIAFAISRFVRVYPMYWCGVIITSLVIIYFGNINEQVTFLSFFMNLTLLNDYLNIDDIDGVYWTLQLELKFYACIFLLLMCGQFQYYQRWLTIWLFLVIIYFFTGQPFFLGWFINPGYSCFFIMGIAFYLIYEKGLDGYNGSILLLSFIMSSVYSFEQSKQFISQVSLIDQYIAVAILWLQVLIFVLISTNKIIFSPKRYLLTLGALTYPLYLFHNVIGKLLIEHFEGFLGKGIAILIVIILMLLLSYLFHRLIDGKFSLSLKNKLTSFYSTIHNPIFYSKSK